MLKELQGQFVSVYRNLHNRHVGYSVKHAGKVRSQRGGVHIVQLRDASFKVSEAGRQRVLRENKKYVHAYAVGELSQAGDYLWAAHHHSDQGKMSEIAWMHDEGFDRAKYDPKKGPDFTLDGRALAGADVVLLNATGMWVKGPRYK
tara:strand:- start:2671 stop:3108 length:438 start_codon:yes stop_codon:yes gene_type:complete